MRLVFTLIALVAAGTLMAQPTAPAPVPFGFLETLLGAGALYGMHKTRKSNLK